MERIPSSDLNLPRAATVYRSVSREIISLQNESDAVLLGRIANGESEPVAVLIHRYRRPLMNFLERTSPCAAADLFQETWIRVVRSAASYDPAYRFTPWLFRIAWNLTRSDWARREREGYVEAAPNEALADQCDSAEAEMIRTERERRIRTVIESLPPQQAEAVLLRYFEDLSERDMAQRLGVPAGTVKSRLHHALRRLAPALREDAT